MLKLLNYGDSIIALERQYNRYNDKPKYKYLCKDSLIAICQDVTTALELCPSLHPEDKQWLENKRNWAKNLLLKDYADAIPNAC